MILYNVGDGFEFEQFISANDEKRCTEVMGDLTPIHLDVEFAENRFSKSELYMVHFWLA
jgi:acyl dehydratase